MTELQLITNLNILKHRLLDDIGQEHTGVVEEFLTSVGNQYTMFFDPKTVEPFEHREKNRD